MQVEHFSCEVIHVPERMRKHIDDERVKQLASSIEAIGLQTPITVFHGYYKFEGEETGGPILVAGLHRLRAMQQLGRAKIPCVVSKMPDLDRELWEIDENLARAELTTDEKREHLRRRKEVWETKQKELAGASCATQVDSRGQRKSPQQQKAFAADTAAATGLSKSQINRLLADPKPATPKPVRIADEPLNEEEEATEKQIAALMTAWNKAGPEARERFLARIDRPVFDNTAAA